MATAVKQVKTPMREDKRDGKRAGNDATATMRPRVGGSTLNVIAEEICNVRARSEKKSEFEEIAAALEDDITRLAAYFARRLYPELKGAMDREDLAQVLRQMIFEEYMDCTHGGVENFIKVARRGMLKKRLIDHLRAAQSKGRTISLLRNAALELENEGKWPSLENLSDKSGRDVKWLERHVWMIYPPLRLQEPLNENESDSGIKQEYVPSRGPTPAERIIPEDPSRFLLRELGYLMPLASLKPIETLVIALKEAETRMLPIEEALAVLEKEPNGKAKVRKIRQILEENAELRQKGLRQKGQTLLEIGKLFGFSESMACIYYNQGIAKCRIIVGGTSFLNELEEPFPNANLSAHERVLLALIFGRAEALGAFEALEKLENRSAVGRKVDKEGIAHVLKAQERISIKEAANITGAGQKGVVGLLEMALEELKEAEAASFARRRR